MEASVPSRKKKDESETWCILLYFNQSWPNQIVWGIESILIKGKQKQAKKAKMLYTAPNPSFKNEYFLIVPIDVCQWFYPALTWVADNQSQPMKKPPGPITSVIESKKKKTYLLAAESSQIMNKVFFSNFQLVKQKDPGTKRYNWITIVICKLQWKFDDKLLTICNKYFYNNDGFPFFRPEFKMLSIKFDDRNDAFNRRMRTHSRI